MSGVRAYDPVAMEKARGVLPEVQICGDAYEVADGADALVIATEWADFRTLDWKKIHGLMARPLVIDGRNLLNHGALERVSGSSTFHSVDLTSYRRRPRLLKASRRGRIGRSKLS
jgi:UDP-N-acetyl-D-mannosaminuronate dehydrogenase